MLLDIGGFEDTPSKQDLLLMVKIIANGYRIICVKEILVDYLEQSKGKISTTEPNPRIAKGFENLRNFCEKCYYELSETEERDTRYRFARTLCLQYIGLNNKKKAFREILEMIKSKPLNIGNLKMILRFSRLIKI